MTSLQNFINFLDTEITVILVQILSTVTMDWHDLNERGLWGDFWTVAITHHQVTSTQNQKQTIFSCKQVPQIQTSQAIQIVHILQPVQLPQPSAPPGCI